MIEAPTKHTTRSGCRSIDLAQEIRDRYNIHEIDTVAEQNDIFLIRSRGKSNGPAGFAHVEHHTSNEWIESLARPGDMLRVWEPHNTKHRYSIVININSPIPEAEIFWHEYYHIFYSPEGIQGNRSFEHRYLVELSDTIEERRANEFAAAILVPEIADCETPFDVMERYSVSGRIAHIASKLYSHLINE